MSLNSQVETRVHLPARNHDVAEETNVVPLVPLSLEEKVLTIMHDVISEFSYLGKALDKIRRDVPDYVTYHNYPHTRDVIFHTILHALLAGEGVDVIKGLVKAATYHDISHAVPGIKGAAHEPTAAMMARHDMEEAGEPEDEIDRVCGAILDTQLELIDGVRKQRCGSAFSRYLLDGDLSSFGTKRFFAGTLNLWEEISGVRVMSIEDLKDADALSYLRDAVALLSAHKWQTIDPTDSHHPYNIGKARNVNDLQNLVVALESGNDELATRIFNSLKSSAQTDLK